MSPTKLYHKKRYQDHLGTGYPLVFGSYGLSGRRGVAVTPPKVLLLGGGPKLGSIRVLVLLLDGGPKSDRAELGPADGGPYDRAEVGPDRGGPRGSIRAGR